MKLVSDNYFSLEADNHYMSNSQFKLFMDCEARAMAKLKGEWVESTITAMEVGQYVHAWNEGQLERFKRKNPHVFRKDGELKADFKQAEDVISCISQDELFMNALSGQKEVILTAELFGTPWKILIDSYFPDAKRFGDLKVLRDIHQRFWNDTIQFYQGVFDYRGYFTQMAIYAEIERIANGRAEGDYFEPFLAVVTKEADGYPDKEIISFVSDETPLHEFIQSELMPISHSIDRVLDVKAGITKPSRCGKCGYCRKTKKLTGTRHYTEFVIRVGA